MNERLDQAVVLLDESRALLVAGTLSPVDYAARRDRALAQGLRAMAADFGVELREPLAVDTNGEFTLVALHPLGAKPTDGCGCFGAEFAQALTRHQARTGIVATTLAGESGWCRIYHYKAEQMLREHHAAQPVLSS